jgi:hypothetical protein
MSQTIRLLSDFGFYPFYVDSGDGFFALTEPDEFRARFQVPDHVTRTLLDWDEVYQDLLDWDDPASAGWPSPEDRERYVTAGRTAARLLRRYVPDDVRIKYLADGNIPPEYY